MGFPYSARRRGIRPTGPMPWLPPISVRRRACRPSEPRRTLSRFSPTRAPSTRYFSTAVLQPLSPSAKHHISCSLRTTFSPLLFLAGIIKWGKNLRMAEGSNHAGRPGAGNNTPPRKLEGLACRELRGESRCGAEAQVDRTMWGVSRGEGCGGSQHAWGSIVVQQAP